MANKYKCKRCKSTNNVKYREIKCKLSRMNCTLETFHCEDCFKSIVSETQDAGYTDIKYDTPI